MTHHALQVENIAKEYILGLREQAHQTFRESVMSLATAPIRRLQQLSGRVEEGRFWALRDINFNVAEGEVLGIIGHNGAGKSTLLKILSRITEPTCGRATVWGRVASLLEVGTGFHQELSGRENVFLNGAILGMAQADIKRKFDEIVEFAGVDQFLDTPIKRYSSGMKVRLAFAVAAHLEPEVLIIDEVLAVGDAEFQSKCLGKMNDVATSGRTVLFVSHNMAAVEALCDRCLLLNGGHVVTQGDTQTILADYIAGSLESASTVVDLVDHPGRKTGGRPLMTRAWLTEGVQHDETAATNVFPMQGDLNVHVEFDSPDHTFSPVLGVVIKTSMGVPVFGNDNRCVAGYTYPARTRNGEIVCRFSNLPLMPGRYVIDLYLGDEQRSLDTVSDSLSIQIVAANVTGTGKLPSSRCGPIYWPATWELH